MRNMQWFNNRLPQMLQGAIVFSYLNAAMAIIFGLGQLGFYSLIAVLGGLGGFGIANERKWGYRLCVGVSIVFLLLQVLAFFRFPFNFGVMLNLLFGVFLVALLLHPISRSYQRIYFR